MKTMWCSDGGVSKVTVREENGVLLVSDGGWWWAAEPGTLHETETEARRACVEWEASKLDEEAERYDRQRIDAEKLAKGHLDDAEWNRDKAAEMRAKAKELRDALAEVKA